MNKLDGAVAVVLDRSDSDLRRAIVDALLTHGAAVVVPDATGPGHDRLSSYDGELDGPEAVEALFASAVSHHGKVDVVVLTGLQFEDRRLSELDRASWAAGCRELELLVWGIRAGVERMTRSGGGRVIVTLGAEAKVGRPGAAIAATVGHAAYGMVKVAAKEGGPHGVTVNAVMSNHRASDSLTGRATDTTEVAAAVVLLASSAGGGMSAVAFPVDGGVAPY